MQSHFHMKGIGTKTRFNLRKRLKVVRKWPIYLRALINREEWGEKLKERVAKRKNWLRFCTIRLDNSYAKKENIYIYLKASRETVGVPSCRLYNKR